MNDKNNKKILFIQPKEYSYDLLEPQLTYFENLFREILEFLNISTPSGKPISIKLEFPICDPYIYEAQAIRVSKDPPEYKIYMSAGMSHLVWIWAQTFSHESNILLPWIDQIKVFDENLNKLGINRIIAELAYYLGSYLIILHEVSHICLGHIDYLSDNFWIDQLKNRQSEGEKISPHEIYRKEKIQRAFEADADRQAGEWLIGIFEKYLEESKLGKCLSFPSQLHKYEFYSYAIALVFVNLQYFSTEEDPFHPKPNERIYIQSVCLAKYLSQKLTEDQGEIHLHILNLFFDVCRKTLVVDFRDLKAVGRALEKLAFVDDVLKETKIRDYQHKFAPAY